MKVQTPVNDAMRWIKFELIQIKNANLLNYFEFLSVGLLRKLSWKIRKVTVYFKQTI